MNLEDLKIQEAKAILYSRMKQPDRVMGNSTAVKDFLSLELAAEGREVFAVLFLDSQHRLIAFERLFLGTIDSASVYPREVLKAAILHNASAVILAHNHPSGVADPSEADMHHNAPEGRFKGGRCASAGSHCRRL